MNITHRDSGIVYGASLPPTTDLFAPDGGRTAHDNPAPEIWSLASTSNTLAKRLFEHMDTCGNFRVALNINDVGTELTEIATTLFDLSETIRAHPQAYTEAFKRDVKINTDELMLIIDESSECAEALTRMGSREGWNDRAAPGLWFFKKGRCARLMKHLQFLKAQLNLMRIVLADGEENRRTGDPPISVPEAQAAVLTAMNKAHKATRELLELELRIHTELLAPNDSTNVTQDTNNVLTSPDATQPESSSARETTDSLPLKRRFTQRAQKGVGGFTLDIGNSPIILRHKWVQGPALVSTRHTTVSESSDPFSDRHAFDDNIVCPVATRPRISTTTVAQNLEAQQEQAETEAEAEAKNLQARKKPTHKKSMPTKLLRSSKKNVSRLVHKLSSSLSLGRHSGGHGQGAYDTVPDADDDEWVSSSETNP